MKRGLHRKPWEGKVSEFIEAVTEAVSEVGDELFPPKPGGLVDRYRQRKAAEEAQIEDEANAAERIEAPSYRAVKVAPESPEVLSAYTYTIAPTSVSVVPILAANPYRHRAIINLVTASASVVITKDQSAALGGVGYTIASANPLLSLFYRGQLWAYNPGGSSIQVSVLTESYAREG